MNYLNKTRVSYHNVVLECCSAFSNVITIIIHNGLLIIKINMPKYLEVNFCEFIFSQTQVFAILQSQKLLNKPWNLHDEYSKTSRLNSVLFPAQTLNFDM